MREILRIARREIAAFFASPVAYLFLGAFLAVTLFIFFWVETFFARNIADVAPLFKWMPVLLIFLVAAITMRMWSEERRSGTLEVLMTAPVSSLQLVLGKFLACIALVIVALALTFSLPVTVAIIGPLDWGPVIGGYLATVLLAAAYAAIGLYISARTDNQIVSLIGTVLVGAGFYLIGSDALTGLFARDVSEILALLGTGARFESITRGVLDLRDLYYYVSIVGVFLTLNVYSLERLRWSHGAGGRGGHRSWRLAALLFVANFIAANLWLAPVAWARADITEGNIYSISNTTQTYLGALQEPLIIRGYFSDKTHPLLAPLVPRLKNLLRQYAAVGGDMVHLQFVEPLKHPKRAREAAQQYGITPVPFRTRSKYGTSIVNSYFNVLIKYGDEHVTLSFKELVGMKRSVGDVSVRLRNPEYAITRSIRKVVYAYRGSGDVFASLEQPVTFRGYISPKQKLPEKLAELRGELEAALADIKAASGGEFRYEIRNPMAGGGALADRIRKKYGFVPMVAGLLNHSRFYFYMVLTQDGQSVTVPIPESLTAAGLKQAIKEALERFAGGTLRTIAVYAPDGGSGRLASILAPSYNALIGLLRDNAIVKRTDLESGRVPPGSDILLVVAPWQLGDKQVFAIDQFLMRGGTVVIAASTFDIDMGPRGLDASKRETGLGSWLAAKGLKLGEAMVMDPQSMPYPLPVRRDVGGFSIRQVYRVQYPYFPAIRGGGMSGETAITSGINQLTMTWAAPIRIDDKALGKLEATPLLYSSPGSWLSDSSDIIPELTKTGVAGFEPHGQRKPRLLGVVVEGSFQSWFKDRPNPMLASDGKDSEAGQANKDEADGGSGGSADKADDGSGDESGPVVTNVITHSPPSARLVLFSSASFVSDLALGLVGRATGNLYRAPVHLLQNTVDWALQDPGLLALRGDTHFSRVLPPLSPAAEIFWEYVNYAYALFGLLVLFGLHRMLRRRTERRYLAMLNQGSA